VINSVLEIWLLIGLAVGFGLPVAALMDGRRSKLAVLVVEGSVIGLLWFGLVGTALARWADATPSVLLGMTAPIAIAAWILAVRTRHVRVPKRPAPLVGVVAALTVLGSLIRSDPVHFVFAIGDFGEFIARANALAEQSVYPDGFLPQLTVVLGEAQMLIGRSDLTLASAALGTLLIPTSALAVQRITGSAIASGAVALLVTVGAVPTWFGAFPATETLYAVVLVALVYYLAKAAARDGRTTDAVMVGACALSLGLTRGNAAPFAVVLLATVLVVAPAVSPEALRRLSLAALGAASAIWIAVLYAARYHYEYFVERQLESLSPGFLFPALERLDDAPAAALMTAIVAMGLAVWWFAGRALNLVGRRFPAEGAAVTAALLVVAIAASAAIVWARGPDEPLDGVWAFGFLPVALAALGLLAVIFGRRDDVRLAVGALAVLTIGAFLVVHATRLPELAEHAFYRYPQRYLFSEVYPLTIILGGIGLAAIIGVVARNDSVLLRTVTATALLLFVGIGLVGNINDGNLQRQRVLFADDYEQIAAIGGLMPDRERPILYQGTGRFPIFSNNYRVVAEPLRLLFGRRIANSIASPFSSDPMLRGAEIITIAREQGDGTVYVLSVGADGAAPELPRLPAGSQITDTKTTEMRIPYLRHTHPQEGWRVAVLDVRVTTVATGGSDGT
jgi:hypothetical protein